MHISSWSWCLDAVLTFFRTFAASRPMRGPVNENESRLVHYSLSAWKCGSRRVSRNCSRYELACLCGALPTCFRTTAPPPPPQLAARLCCALLAEPTITDALPMLGDTNPRPANDCRLKTSSMTLRRRRFLAGVPAMQFAELSASRLNKRRVPTVLLHPKRGRAGVSGFAVRRTPSAG